MISTCILTDAALFKVETGSLKAYLLALMVP